MQVDDGGYASGFDDMQYAIGFNGTWAAYAVGHRPRLDTADHFFEDAPGFASTSRDVEDRVSGVWMSTGESWYSSCLQNTGSQTRSYNHRNGPLLDFVWYVLVWKDRAATETSSYHRVNPRSTRKSQLHFWHEEWLDMFV